MNRLIACLVAFALSACAAAPARETPLPPPRVLLTNDDGVAEPRLAILARAFADAGAEVWVVAADADRSGYSNFTPATRTGGFVVRSVDMGPGITAFELQGAPADCVVFALTGPMRERLPDLVVSGPNGGDNAGDDWFGSGTIGAARTAAYLGVPAIAVSGFAEQDADDRRRAAQWIVSLTRHSQVRAIEPPTYLTISFPERPLSEVRGLEVTQRAQRLLSASAEREDAAEGEWRRWRLRVTRAEPEPNTDVAALARGNIAIVPMRVGDEDSRSVQALSSLPRSLPPFPPTQQERVQ